MFRRVLLVSSLLSVIAVVSPQAALACVTGDPEMVYMTGLEHGLSTTESGWPFSTGSNSGGTGGPDSALARTGIYSLRLAPSGGYVFRGRVVAWQPVLVERFYLRLNSLPAADVRELASIYTIKFTGKGNSPRYALHLGYEQSTNRLTIELNTQNPGARVEGPTVIPGTWHLIEIKYDVSTTNNTAEWRVDNVEQPTVQLSNGPSTLINEVIWGSTFSDTFVANYDDLMVSQTGADYPLEGGRILLLKPNDSAGPHSNPNHFVEVSATGPKPIDATTWTSLNEVPMAKGAHIAQTTNSSTSYVQIGFEDTAEACIRAVYGWISYDPLNGKRNSNNGKTSVFDGSTESVIYSGAMVYPSTNIWIKGAPVHTAGSDWNMLAVNGLAARVGYSTDTTPRPWWDGLLLEYEATP